jgi:VWFA-related protein
MSRVVLCIVVLAASAALAAQQAPPAGPVLRAAVDQVVVDVIVTDASGAPVSGLTAADFEIRERGKAQTIGTFSEVSLPLTSRPEGAPLPPAGARGDTRSADATAVERRLYVLLLDDQHVSLDLSAEVRRTAHAFVRRFVQPGDLVAVVTTARLGDGRHDVTDDLPAVEAAIDRFTGMLGPAAALITPNAAGERNVDRLGGVDTGSDTAAEETARAVSALHTLGSVAEGLASVHGRKAVLYVSEGFDADPGDRRTDERASLLRDILDAAARANVTLYTFNPGGLNQHGNVMAAGLSPAGMQQSRPGADRRARMRFLSQLAERTGGTASIDTNSHLSALERVAVESSHYYLLGYVPAESKRDGGFRPIEVRARRPELRVSARQGYYAPKDKK